MDTDTKLKFLTGLELAFLAATVSGLMVFGPQKSQQFRLYEFIGLFTSAVISTEGIRRMKILTAE